MTIREVAEALGAAEGPTTVTSRGLSMRTMGTTMDATAMALETTEVAITMPIEEAVVAGSSSQEGDQIGATQEDEVLPHPSAT